MAYNIAPSKQDLLVSGTNIKTINGSSVLGSGNLTISGGVTTVGAFSGSSQTNGASISSTTITFGPADGTNPGMITIGTQSFAGQKTFSGLFQVQATSASGDQVRIGDLSNNWYFKLGRNNNDGCLDFTGTQTNEGGYRFNTTNTVNALVITGNGGAVAISKELSANTSIYTPKLGINLAPAADANLAIQFNQTYGLKFGDIGNGWYWTVARDPNDGLLNWRSYQSQTGYRFDGVTGSRFIINEDGVDFDFRVEGDTDANLLFIDASTDRVGVGLNNPSVKFEVNGNAKISSGDLSIATAGKGLAIKGGSNARIGTASLVAANSVTVTTTALQGMTTPLIFLTGQDGTDAFSVNNINTTAGTFDIVHSSGNVTATVAWMIIETA